MQYLKPTQGRVIVKIDLDGKNWHTFSNGQTIRLERQYDNFNRRETEPVNAIVVSSDYIPKGSEILIHHNATHDMNRIFNLQNLSGEETSSTVKYFSIPEGECFTWNDGGEWQPTKSFDFGLRVFKPYTGILDGILPTYLKEKLFMTTGEYKNKVVITLKSVDYEIVFQGMDGKEQRLIRCRPNGDDSGREPEVIAIDNEATKKVLEGEYIVGLNEITAKIFNNANKKSSSVPCYG